MKDILIDCDLSNYVGYTIDNYSVFRKLFLLRKVALYGIMLKIIFFWIQSCETEMKKTGSKKGCLCWKQLFIFYPFHKDSKERKLSEQLCWQQILFQRTDKLVRTCPCVFRLKECLLTSSIKTPMKFNLIFNYVHIYIPY